MTVEVVGKRKGGAVCADCGQKLPSDAGECTSCGSKKIKKSLVIVRKAVGDSEEELESAVGVDDSVEDEELDDEDLEDEDDEDEDEEGDEEDADDDEDEEDEDDEEEDDESSDDDVEKSDPHRDLEILNIATAFAEDVAKVFSAGTGRSGYEDVMMDLNNIMDSAAEKWFGGTTITKAEDAAGHAALIRERVNGMISKEGKKMPRPKELDFDSLDDATKKYIEGLENGKTDDGVAKSTITKRDDLPEDVRKSLDEADKIVEENKVAQWTSVAKSYSHLPGKVEDNAKMLRSLSESNPTAFEELKKSLDAAQELFDQSEILKSYGRPGGGEDTSISKRTAQAKELVEKGLYPTVEQAEVALMGADDYQPTNV